MNSHAQSKYLVCVDDTDMSRNALRFACIKGKKRNIQIDVLHVLPPMEMQALPAIGEKMREEQMVEAEILMKAMVEEAKNTTGVEPTCIIRMGNPADEIIAQAQDHYINMLVLGVTPHNSNSGRKIISVLTNQSCDKLHIPIMLVPGNMTEEEMIDFA